MEEKIIVNIQIDIHDIEAANSILKRLGLDMNTYINMAIKQLIYKDGVPFDIINSKTEEKQYYQDLILKTIAIF